jgi:MFS family permease
MQHPMISLARYHAVLQRRDMRQLLTASLIGRLPIGLTGLAILLLVQGTTRSFAYAGAAAACYVGGLALLAPALGRLIDRIGPQLPLLLCGVVFPAAMLALIAAVTAHAPAWLTLVIAACAGAGFPPITVCMRTYFRQHLAEEALLATAYSLESVLIELIFILGPLIVALFVALAGAEFAVAFSALCSFAGTLLFRRAPALRDWRIERRTSASLLGPLHDRGFATLVAIILCFATAFGFMEVAVTAYAAEKGNAALAGVLLGLMSAGSAFGGLAYGSRHWPAPLPRQFALALALMGAGFGLLALDWATWIFVLLSVLAGIVMAPALIIQSMLVAKTAQPEHATEAFTWATSALLSGVGIGLAVGGALLEAQRWPVALGAAGATALAAAGGALLLKSRD